MNDTPISDEAWHRYETEDDGSDVPVVPLVLARRLERDRAELIEALRELLNLYDVQGGWTSPEKRARDLLSRLEKDKP